MYSTRILTTADAALAPPNYGPNLSWDRLTGILRRELDPDAAQLLAEPVRDEGRGETNWHVDSASDPVPISALSPKDREMLLERLTELRAKIRRYASSLEKAGGDENIRLAAALRDAIRVPDDSSYVWSLDGLPVLAGWGCKAGPTSRSSHVISREKGAGQADLASEETTQEAAKPVAARPDLGWLLPALLWLLFIGTTLATAYRLLPACSVDLPLIRSFFDVCPDSGRNQLAALWERNHALRDAIEKAETKVAVERPPCPPEDSSKTQKRAERPTVEETEKRVHEAGGKHGKLDITLSWNGHADLDLYVYCPGGELSYHSKNGCGSGEFEIDRNAGSPLIDAPIEHASWSEEPPSGHYSVDVHLFDYRDAPAEPVPFVLVITENGVPRTITGIARAKGETIRVTEFQH